MTGLIEKAIDVIPTTMFIVVWMRVVLLGPQRIDRLPGLGWSPREMAFVIHLVKIAGVTFLLLAALFLVVGPFDPSMLGRAPVDPETMRRTVKKVMQVWQLDRAWGWDFPMAAMAAARVGEPELAIQALLIDSPKNLCHPNGHVYQRPNLTAYLPANGGLLAAVAMMAAGWSDGPKQNASGFPADGKWSVKHEWLGTWI